MHHIMKNYFWIKLLVQYNKRNTRKIHVNSFMYYFYFWSSQKIDRKRFRWWLIYMFISSANSTKNANDGYICGLSAMGVNGKENRLGTYLKEEIGIFAVFFPIISKVYIYGLFFWCVTLKINNYPYSISLYFIQTYSQLSTTLNKLHILSCMIYSRWATHTVTRILIMKKSAAYMPFMAFDAFWEFLNAFF